MQDCTQRITQRVFFASLFGMVLACDSRVSSRENLRGYASAIGTGSSQNAVQSNVSNGSSSGTLEPGADEPLIVGQVAVPTPAGEGEGTDPNPSPSVPSSPACRQGPPDATIYAYNYTASVPSTVSYETDVGNVLSPPRTLTGTPSMLITLSQVIPLFKAYSRPTGTCNLPLTHCTGNEASQALLHGHLGYILARSNGSCTEVPPYVGRNCATVGAPGFYCDLVPPPPVATVIGYGCPADFLGTKSADFLVNNPPKPLVSANCPTCTFNYTTGHHAAEVLQGQPGDLHFFPPGYTSSESCSGPSLPFADGFTTFDQWTVNLGSYTLENGALKTDPVFFAANVMGTSLKDAALSADVEWSPTMAPALGLRMSGAGDASGYYALVHGLKRELQVYKNVGGSWSMLGSKALMGAGTSGALAFSAIGTRLFATLGNDVKLILDDSTIQAAGKVGIRDLGGSTFKNFKVAVAEAPAPPTLPFTAGLSINGTLDYPYWEPVVGSFAVAGGKAAAAGAPMSVAILRGFSVADVTLTAKITLAPESFPGLVLRKTGLGDQNMYVGLMNHLAPAQLQIFKNTAGLWTMLGSTPVPGGARSGVLSFRASGDQLTLSFDGVEKLRVTDTSISGPGAIGLRSNGGAEIENFVASQ